MSVSDRLLRQYLAEALDPPETERIAEMLAADPALRRRLALLIATTAGTPSLDIDFDDIDDIDDAPLGWFVPPPAAIGRLSLSGSAAQAAVMDEQHTGWMVLQLDVRPEHLEHHVMVLERSGTRWSIVLPTTPEELHPVGTLPKKGDQIRLDLAFETSPARLAVILLPPDRLPDFALPPEQRWGPIQEALVRGELPVVSFETG